MSGPKTFSWGSPGGESLLQSFILRKDTMASLDYGGLRGQEMRLSKDAPGSSN